MAPKTDRAKNPATKAETKATKAWGRAIRAATAMDRSWAAARAAAETAMAVRKAKTGLEALRAKTDSGGRRVKMGPAQKAAAAETAAARAEMAAAAGVAPGAVEPFSGNQRRHLVGRNQKQDQLFSVLVGEHADMLMAFIRSTVWDASAAEDIFQETMVVAWRRFMDYDPARPLARWLRGIARKLILSYLSKLKRNPVYCIEDVLDVLEERMAHVDRLPGDAWSDKVEALAFCMDQLPEDMQQCVRLFYQDEKKTDQIASALETTREVIKKRLQRARSRLADCLRRKGVFPAFVQEGVS